MAERNSMRYPPDTLKRLTAALRSAPKKSLIYRSGFSVAYLSARFSPQHGLMQAMPSPSDIVEDVLARYGRGERNFARSDVSR